MSEAKLSHVGGPTLLIEFEGWRILTDPTFDPPGGKYNFGWGTSWRKNGRTGGRGGRRRPPRRRHRDRPSRRRPLPDQRPAPLQMTGTEAADLCRRLAPATVVPIHYDGWSHFREKRTAAESELATGLAGGPKITWLEPGTPSSIEV